MDQRKLDVVRRALGVDTETEAIDQALDLVAFREELANGFALCAEAAALTMCSNAGGRREVHARHEYLHRRIPK